MRGSSRAMGSLALLVFLALASSGLAAVAPGKHGLTLVAVRGTAALRGTGTLRGVVGSGSVWVSDDTGAFEFLNAHECRNEMAGEKCHGTHLRFRLLARGPYSVRLQGSA